MAWDQVSDASEENHDLSGTHCADITVVASLSRAAKRTPDALAVIDGAEAHDYASLLSDVRQLAALLRARGVRTGDRVGVALERSYRGIVAMIAVLYAGGAYVPLDGAYPADRLLRMVQGCEIRSVVGSSAALRSLPDAIGAAHIDADEAAPADASRIDPSPVPPPAPGDFAYVLHTSGSTGPPKGVLVPHGALAAAVRSLTAVFGVTAQDRVLSFASMNWDTSGEEIYPTLSAGATLVIDRRAVSGSVMGLFTAVEAHSITVLDLPTSFWTEVVDFLDVSGRPFPRSLRLVVIGGEEVRAGAVRSWCEHVPDDVRLLNTYGQTETALVTHAADVGGIRGRFLTDTARVPIGEPLPHVRQVLVSVDAGPGVAELLIGGPSVALGYQNLPAETAERFITLPGAGGERFYRTGDLVEARPDGQLTYIGRADRQLKVRGFRIEPEEVERALLTHPGLRAVAVRAAASPGGGQRLAATVVTVADARVTKSELGEWLKARVPPHMVPTLISFTGALPLLPNGKIDYAMLDNHSDMPSPTDAAASEIASIAGRILNRPLDVKEDFFEGGGDSLLATRLISRIYKAFDVELTFVDVFDARTPQQLAALVVRANGATFNRAGA